MKLWNARRPLGPSRRGQNGRVTVWSTDSAGNEENMFWAETREAAKEVASSYWDCNPADVVVRRTRLGIDETHYKPPIEAREFKLIDEQRRMSDGR